MNKMDEQFMIRFGQTNRDFLTNAALFHSSSLMSVSALLISVFSLIHSLRGFTTYTISVGVVFLIMGSIYWAKEIPKAKSNLKNAKILNDHLQEKLFRIYPEYRNEYY